MSGPWEKYREQMDGPWRKYAKGSDPAATAEMNAKTEADIQAARDEGYVSENPFTSRVNAFNAGLPFIGGWMDEVQGAVSGVPAEQWEEEQDAFSRARPGQDAALRLAGGVTGTVATLPFALPGLTMAKAGSSLGKAGATALEAALMAGGEGAVYGAGEGEAGHRGEAAVKQALLQALVAAPIGGLAGAVAGRAQSKAAVDAVPEISDLKAAGSALYETGRATGQTASPRYTQTLYDRLTDIGKAKGIISPTGRLATSYTKISDALAMAKDYAGQKMNPSQMQTVRESLQAAAQSADGKEARYATEMLKAFDEFVAPLVPQFKEGDKLWARAMRGEEIDNTIKSAGTRRFGAEASLSNEFGSLARKEIRGDLTYPQELVEAVERVAVGKGGQGIAREFGRFSPTGPGGFLSSVASPAAVGAYFAGPLGAAAAGGTAGTTGLVGRLLANQLAKDNAQYASAVARNGAPLEAVEELPENIRALIAALLAREGVSAAAGPQ